MYEILALKFLHYICVDVSKSHYLHAEMLIFLMQENSQEVVTSK